MTDSDPADAGHSTVKKPSGETQRQPPLPHRRPPPMRVVTKGWWTLEEREADVEELEKQDRDERKQA